MVTSRSIARCLLFLSVNVILMASVNARPGHDLALAVPTPAPIVPRAILPGANPDKDPTTGTTTSQATPTDTGAPNQNQPNPNSPTDKNTATDTGKDTPTNTSPGTTPGTSTPPGTVPTSPTTSNPPDTPKDTGTPTDTSTPNNSKPTDTTTSDTPTQPPPSNTNTDPLVTPSLSTGADGSVKTVMETVVETASQSSSSPTDSASSKSDSDKDTKPSSGINTSTIIGLSVSGGVALLGIAAFVIWKFTRKRSLDDDFDNEAIKWPELNAHGENAPGATTLPGARAGPAAFETSSQVNLTRPDSRAGSIATSAAGSAADLFAQRDPYAVPPLPTLNPNTPYRDDPYQDESARAYPYYDGYHENAEAYQMNQMRARSPGPQMAIGRASPAPQATLGVDYRTRSPGPAASLYSGRVSPAPPMGRMSPGPQMAYNPAGGY